MRYFFSVIICGIIFLNFLSLAFPINFSSYWNFSKSSEAPLRKDQGYFFSFSRDLTPRMNFGGSLNYMKTETEDTWRKNTSLAFYYNLINDLFSYNLSYNYRLVELNTNEKFKSWNIGQNFRTDIKKFYIGLYWNKNKSWTEGLEDNSKSTDTGMGISINRRFDEWYLKGLSTLFDYRIIKSEDLVSGSETKNTFLTFKMDYSRSFKKINFGISQELNKIKTEATYQLGESGKYKIEYSLSLTNGTFNATLNAGDIFYLQFPSDKTLKGIDFYTDYSTFQKIGSNARWDIYYSKDKINWTLVTTNVTLPYEFSTSLAYPNIYIKLEVTSVVGIVNLTDPRFVGYYYETESHEEREDTYYRATVHFSIRLPHQMFLSTSSGYENYNYEDTPDKKRYYYNLNLSWSENKYFRPNLSYFYTVDKQEDVREDKSRGYSISISSIPFRTIKLNSGYTYTKSWENGTPISENQNLFFSEHFEIYPDLTSVLSQSYSKSENLETGAESKSYSAQFNFLARLRPNITLEFRNSFVKSETSEGGESSHFRRHEAFLTWRFSDYFSFTTTQIYDKSEDTHTYYYSYIFYIVPAEKLRLNLSYSGSESEDSENSNLGVNAFWTLTPKLNLNWNYNYNKRDGESTWSWFFRIRYVF